MNLDRCSFGTAFSLSYVTQYVRTTHYLTPNHPRGQFVLYVQNSCFLASLFSPWKYYVLYFAFELCQLIIYHPSLEEGGAEGNPGADLHPAPFKHPYTCKSTTTPSGVHFMFVGLPVVETSHLPHNPSHISIRHMICSLINTASPVT